MSKIKKFLIIFVVLAIAVAGTVFGLGTLKKKNTEKKKVDVYAVSEISADGSWFGSGDFNSGYVDATKEQRVYVGKSQKVAEVRVSEGDTVKAGDVLAVYDVTAKELQLEIQRTALEVTRARIESARYDLRELQNTTPVEPKPEPKPDDSTEYPIPEPNIPDVPDVPDVPDIPQTEETTEEPGRYPNPDEPTENPLPGYEQEPVGGLINEGAYILNDEVVDVSKVDTQVLYSRRDNILREEDDQYSETTEENEKLDDPDASDDLDGDEEPKKPEYTQKELDEAIKMKQEEINRMEINYQLELIAFQILEYQSTSGEVYCNIDGVVKTVLSEDEAAAENKPMIVVGSEDGYALKSSIGELALTKVKPGDTVTLDCYEDGMTYKGKVTEISNLPEANDYGYYSYDGSSQSYYPITIAITDADNLRQGMYMDITYDTMKEEKDNSLYLLMPFVKKEGGRYYVMKSVDGKLQKQYISTGKIVYNEYCEILSGVSYDDQLAFPYSSDAEEGIQTELKSFDESFMY